VYAILRLENTQAPNVVQNQFGEPAIEGG